MSCNDTVHFLCWDGTVGKKIGYLPGRVYAGIGPARTTNFYAMPQALLNSLLQYLLHRCNAFLLPLPAVIAAPTIAYGQFDVPQNPAS